MVRKIAWSVGAVLLFTGCASIESYNVKSTEQSLTEAGFKKVVADTPAKAAVLAKLTPRKLVSHQQQGKTVWTYADPKGCNCVYIGNQAAFQNYNNIMLFDETQATSDRTIMDWKEFGTPAF